MTKKDFLRKVSETSGLTIKDCNTALNTILDEIVNVVNEEGEMRFMGFGAFKKSVRPGRKMISPLTGKEIEVKEKNVMRVKFSDNVIEKLNS